MSICTAAFSGATAESGAISKGPQSSYRVHLGLVAQLLAGMPDAPAGQIHNSRNERFANLNRVRPNHARRAKHWWKAPRSLTPHTR